jgi:aryl-alcohol dehydrogenase-like predicted oxidoreductase
MVQSCAWSSLLDLEAVSKRVERVEPAHAGHFVIRASSRTSPVHLDDALTAIELKLTDEEVAELEAPYEPHEVSGM